MRETAISPITNRRGQIDLALLKLPVGVPTTSEVLRGSRRLVIPTDYPNG